MIKYDDVISYAEMCTEEGVNLQRGMNYHLHGTNSIILMSIRQGAPYSDRIEQNGKILIYEGHDILNRKDRLDPKTVDQPTYNKNGTLTQNGLFFKAAISYKNGERTHEVVKVYEKIRPGVWKYNGQFKLVDAWQESINGRKVFKFRLELLVI